MRGSHLEADNVAEEFAGGETDHGDAGDEAVLAEEGSQDHVPLPHIGQIPEVITADFVSRNAGEI